MDHNFGFAFTRQSPVETDDRSLLSKWFARSRHKPKPSRVISYEAPIYRRSQNQASHETGLPS